MNHSVEEIWHNETARRKRLRNWMLLIVCGFLILSVTLWALVTQPLLSTDAPNSQHFPFALLGLFYPSRGNFIAVVGKFGQGSAVRRVKRAMREASALPVYSINAPSFVAGIDFSDHLNYWQAGYDAVMITDTSFYRNRNYHTANDKPETLDYQRLAMAIQGLYAAVLAIAQ